MNKVQTMPVSQPQEDALISVLRESLYPGAKKESVQMVIAYCKALSLDPMQKPVHIVPMWDKNSKGMRDVVMPGIGLYRTQAARTGEYGGITEPDFGPDITEDLDGLNVTYPQWCRVTVSRIVGSNIVKFSAVERWKENYATKRNDTSAPNAMWLKRPYGQLAKCAEAQALRKAFPEVGSLATAEEMEGKSFIEGELATAALSQSHDSASAPSSLPEKEIYSAAAFETNFPKWEQLVLSGKKAPAAIIKNVHLIATLTEEQTTKIENIGKDK